MKRSQGGQITVAGGGEPSRDPTSTTGTTTHVLHRCLLRDGGWATTAETVSLLPHKLRPSFIWLPILSYGNVLFKGVKAGVRTKRKSPRTETLTAV
jgi:hypothetical protein